MAEAVTGRTYGVERRPVYGRAEPAPPRRDPGEVRGLAGKRPKMARKVGFAEGCAQRVRIARPYTTDAEGRTVWVCALWPEVCREMLSVPPPGC